MSKIAIVGAGIAGLSCAQCLKDRHEITVFEKESAVGGLIRCRRVEGSLFHLCGGHVFNTKNQRVLDWFWSRFDRDTDFIKAERHSAVCLEDGRFVDYPIENHVYQLDEKYQHGFVEDVKRMIRERHETPENFEEFLIGRFGKTLYDLYFQRYNEKIWRCDLSRVPLSWLEGKLPMPTVEEMILANFNHTEEKKFVHSTFFYERCGGSQSIANDLAEGIDVRLGSEISEIRPCADNRWTINGSMFDKVIFCGNIKFLPKLLRGLDFGGMEAELARLESHGTTAVFCETDPIPYSWFYQPSRFHRSHRFICTGNFSRTNNAPGKMTCTIEFTDRIENDEIESQLKLMPYHPKLLDVHYTPCSYPIQYRDTRALIGSVKELLAPRNLYLCGRFAEWEYFNMDAAIASAMYVTDMM